LLGKQVELITEDDLTTNPGAVLAFSKLAGQPDIVAFLGEIRLTQNHAPYLDGGEHGDEMTFGDRPLNVDSGQVERMDFSTSAMPRVFLEGRWLWVLARYLGQVQPDADFIPAASGALYTLPRPMFSAVAMSVTERPHLKNFTASSALSRADGLRPM
jgi:hypothetical protein